MPEEPLQDYQPRSFSTWLGIVLLFSFFGLLVLVVLGASSRGSDYEEKRARTRAEKLQALQQETHKALTTYAWVDKSKGIARIPISDAMKLTVAELAQKRPVSANPILAPTATPSAQQTTGPSSATVVPSATGTPKPSSITGPNSEIGSQPAAAANPPPAPPGTQPGVHGSPSRQVAPTTIGSSPSPTKTTAIPGKSP